MPISKYVLTAVIVVLGGLSSCTTLDPYTREEKTSSATKGVAIGPVGALFRVFTARLAD